MAYLSRTSRKGLTKREEARRKTGLCIRGTCESERVTAKFCREHQDKANRKSVRSVKRRMRAMLCRTCGSPTETRLQLCAGCLTKQRDYRRGVRAFRRDNHLCVQCGVPVTRGYAKCMKHRAADAAFYTPKPERTPEQTQASGRHAAMIRWHGREYTATI